MEAFIEEELKRNDELTSTAINASLVRKWPNLRVSTSTIKRVRREIGWVCTRPHYCQLLREVYAVSMITLFIIISTMPVATYANIPLFFCG